MNPTTYDLDGGVATVTMDDGKANALSPTMLGSIGVGLDRAEADGASAVVLAGRPGRFSAGFDLGILQAGGTDAEEMLRGGFRLAERLLDSPRPVVAACTGHAIAMGSFLLCACDLRIGAEGDFRLQANEVLIGLTVPLPAVAILRHRLTPAAFDRAVGLAEAGTPATAVQAGWLDRVVAADSVVAAAQAAARDLAVLDAAAHLGSKRRARAGLLADVRAGIEREYG